MLVLDHEPGERDPNSPFDGVVTSEPSTAWRKALAAQDRGAAAVLFVSDVHNHPGPGNFEAAANSYWPDKPPRILNYMLAAWADRIRIPVAQVSPAVAASLVAGTNRTIEDLGRASETARGFTPLALPGAKVVVQALLDAGFEVTYTGLRQTPEAIAKAAKATNADVVGLSILRARSVWRETRGHWHMRRTYLRYMT